MKQKYGIIYADPPWSYKVWSKKGLGRSAESHYPTMTKEEIRDMGVNEMTDDNCALFLWVTMPCLQEGMDLIEKWGFTYKTVAFVWVKRNKSNIDSTFWGMGHWSRSNVEMVLLGTKGTPKRESKGVHQVVETFEDMDTETISAPIREHSEKPHQVRLRIEELMGDKIPKVELFARQRHFGWDAFGNEIEDSIEIPNTEIIKPHFRNKIKQQTLL